MDPFYQALIICNSIAWLIFYAIRLLAKHNLTVNPDGLLIPKGQPQPKRGCRCSQGYVLVKCNCGLIDGCVKCNL